MMFSDVARKMTSFLQRLASFSLDTGRHRDDVIPSRPVGGAAVFPPSVLPAEVRADGAEEEPADDVDTDAADLREQLRRRVAQVAPQQPRADAEPKHREQRRERQLVAARGTRLVPAGAPQQPSQLQQRVGELRAEDGRHHLGAAPTAHEDVEEADEAEQVVHQHQCPYTTYGTGL